MLSPVVMIGCGGSGSKAVRYVRDAVRRRLRDADWHGALPAAWSFIGLDIPASQEDPISIPPFPPQDYLSISRKYNKYADLSEALLIHYPPHSDSKYLHLIGWRPDPSSTDVDISVAGGKTRAVGRAVGLESLQATLSTKLAAAFGSAGAGGPELKRVSEKLGVPRGTGGKTNRTLAVICASVAGGTGAGIALDVVDLVRRTHADGQYPLLVLFSADIFETPDDSMAANSLGLVCEMLAAYWNTGSSGGGDVFDTTHGKPGHGPFATFVVGSHSMSGTSIGEGSVPVYRAVGEALSAWVVDHHVQQNVQNWISGNWRDHAANNNGGYPFGEEHQRGAVSSFGAATLSVGRDRFEDWARDLLTRTILEGLIYGHSRVGQLPESEKDIPEPERIDQLAAKHYERVYGDENEGAAAYKRYFLSEDLHARQRKDQRESLGELTKAVSTRKGSEWKDIILAHVDWCRDEFAGYQLEENAKASWGADVLAYTCRAVSEVVADVSLPVAVRAVEMAIEEVGRDVKWCEDTGDYMREDAKKELDDVLNRLERMGLGVGEDNSLLGEAIDRAANLLLEEWTELRLDAMGLVLDAVSRELLTEIKRVLGSLRKNTARQLREDEQVQSWPKEEDQIPPRYLPASTELCLEGPGNWGELLRALCRSMAPPELRYRDSVAAARWVLIAGSPGEDSGEPLPSLVRYSGQGSWLPGSGPVSLDHDGGAQGVRDKVEVWMSSGRFGQVLREGLSEYLSAKDRTGAVRSDHEERLNEFERLLSTALDMSQPLVDIDDALHGSIYGGAADSGGARDKYKLKRISSKFPFGPGHPAREITERVLAGTDGGNYEASEVDPSSILVSSFLDNPVHPMVVRSLTDPIAEAVQACRGGAAKLQASFWRWRRSRTIAEFVPMSPAVRLAMIRGFAVARLCGYVTADSTKAEEITGEPDVKFGRAAKVRFPWPLLSPPTSGNDLLASLLESFALCFAEVGAKKQETFAPYSRLYKLGEGHKAVEFSEFSSATLNSFLATGHLRWPTVDTPKAAGATEGERMEAARGYLQGFLRYLKNLSERPLNGTECCDEMGRTHSGVSTMEILDDALEAFQQVMASIGRTPEEQDL